MNQPTSGAAPALVDSSRSSAPAGLELLAVTAPPTPVPFDLATLDRRTDVELDELPFGVIALDPDGTVLRYNAYESRLARLDRHYVLGRGFFSEVARCTRGPAFEGRFREAVASGRTGALARFPFLFDFAFGAQEVAVEIVRPTERPRFYLLVNRRGREVAKPGNEALPLDERGATPAELSPSSARLAGVRTDELGLRTVEVGAAFFAALRATCDRLAPETWPLFGQSWGVAWGRRLAVDLEARALVERGRSLRELPMRDLCGEVAALSARMGLGRVSFELEHARDGALVVRVDRSAFAESLPSPSGARACHVLAGAFESIFAQVARRRLSGHEIACAAEGAPACLFAVVGRERRDGLEQALRGGARGLEALGVGS